MKIDFSKLLPSLALPLVVGFSSGFITASHTQTFFAALIKPPLTPPAWVFGPAWTLLYIFIGIAHYLYWTTPGNKKTKYFGYNIYILQLLANFSWSLLFFGLESPFLGMINIMILWILIIVNILAFRKINQTSAYLLMPYLAWVTFASYLNIGVWFLN